MWRPPDRPTDRQEGLGRAVTHWLGSPTVSLVTTCGTLAEARSLDAPPAAMMEANMTVGDYPVARKTGVAALGRSGACAECPVTSEGETKAGQQRSCSSTSQRSHSIKRSRL